MGMIPRIDKKPAAPLKGFFGRPKFIKKRRYPLEMERLMMGLGDFEGAQLLYLSRGPSVVGRWESVLGPAPAPEVSVYKEVTVRQDATQQETVLLQSAVGSTVLDLLFNYTNADWRGEIFNGNVWGVSAMEALLYALMLWQQMQRCSWVCRTWHRALLPFNDLKRICYRAMQIPALPPPGAVVDLPSLPDLFEAMTSGACFWSEILMISHMPWFQGRAWPMQISEINLMSEMNEDEDHFMEGPTSKALNNYAPMFLKMVRQMLAGIPLAWRTKPYTRGQGRFFFRFCERADEICASEIYLPFEIGGDTIWMF